MVRGGDYRFTIYGFEQCMQLSYLIPSLTFLCEYFACHSKCNSGWGCTLLSRDRRNTARSWRPLRRSVGYNEALPVKVEILSVLHWGVSAKLLNWNSQKNKPNCGCVWRVQDVMQVTTPTRAQTCHAFHSSVSNMDIDVEWLRWLTPPLFLLTRAVSLTAALVT